MVKKMLKNGVFGVESGEGGSVGVRMSEMVGRLERGDLRGDLGVGGGIVPLGGRGLIYVGF